MLYRRPARGRRGRHSPTSYRLPSSRSPVAMAASRSPKLAASCCASPGSTCGQEWQEWRQWRWWVAGLAGTQAGLPPSARRPASIAHVGFQQRTVQLA